MAVRRGTYITATAGGVGTTAVEARLSQAGLVTPNGDLGVVAGVISGGTVTGTTSGWAYSVSATHAVTTRGATDGAAFPTIDGATLTPAPVLQNGSAGSTSAPVSGSRYELIWIQQRDLDNADADNAAVLGVTQGTASGTPSRPTVPTGALVLAEALVPAGAANTAAVTITPVFPRVAARGGVIPVTSQAQRDLLTAAASPTNPIIVDRLDRAAGTLERNATGLASGWRVISSQFDMRAAVVSVPTNASGDGTWTFPTPFANAIVNAVAIDAFGTGGGLGGVFVRYLPSLSDATKASFRVYSATSAPLQSPGVVLSIIATGY